mgnify:CR=1 FL=1
MDYWGYSYGLDNYSCLLVEEVFVGNVVVLPDLQPRLLKILVFSLSLFVKRSDICSSSRTERFHMSFLVTIVTGDVTAIIAVVPVAIIVESVIIIIIAVSIVVVVVWSIKLTVPSSEIHGIYLIHQINVHWVINVLSGTSLCWVNSVVVFICRVKRECRSYCFLKGFHIILADVGSHLT